MNSDFLQFEQAVQTLSPRTALVFGSGLGAAAEGMIAKARVNFADVPGLVPPTVSGHRGQLAVGRWNDIPVLISFGRVHFYEGHSWERVTRLVRIFADFGIRRLILTNAAGGIADSLEPGDLMAIRGYRALLGPGGLQPLQEVFSAVGLATLESLGLPSGIYAALTGPSYETPAEIRALRSSGADAVGMSTAKEAEAAVSLGMEVLGISTITNKAAGLGTGPLSHHEVEQTAKLAVSRLGQVLQGVLSTHLDE